MRDRYYPRTFTCPHCGYEMDGTTGIEGRGDELPDDGDVSVCLACVRLAGFVRVAGGVALRELTPVELADALADVRCAAALSALRETRARVLLAGKTWPTGPTP
jgi:hypothetical protein